MTPFIPLEPMPPIELAPGITMDFQVIPPVSVQKAAHEAGQPLSFLMGSRGCQTGMYAPQEPRQRVIIPCPFFLSTYPLTWAQFDEWVKSEEYIEWFRFNKGELTEMDEGRPRRPFVFGENGHHLAADQITWFESQAYLRWFNALRLLPVGLEARLPNEAEWEYSCRAGSDAEYWNGDGFSARKAIDWFRDGPRIVGHNSNPNGWGLHDMIGPPSEWCLDVFDPRAYAKRGDGWAARSWTVQDAADDQFVMQEDSYSYPTFPSRSQRSGSSAERWGNHPSERAGGLRILISAVNR